MCVVYSMYIHTPQFVHYLRQLPTRACIIVDFFQKQIQKERNTKRNTERKKYRNAEMQKERTEKGTRKNR